MEPNHYKYEEYCMTGRKVQWASQRRNRTSMNDTVCRWSRLFAVDSAVFAAGVIAAATADYPK